MTYFSVIVKSLMWFLGVVLMLHDPSTICCNSRVDEYHGHGHTATGRRDTSFNLGNEIVKLGSEVSRN